jgi:CRISPR-associated endonuclease Csn1
MRYKLGIDLGSTSLGWAIVKIDENNKPIEFLDMGVRIFPDGRDDKTKEPLCVSRRNARSSRVRLDRLLIRKDAVLDLINNNGMSFKIVDKKFIDNNKKICAWDPYYLRTRALDEKLTLPELGRVLFHLSLRRGYLSNRKEDGDENEKSKIASAIKNLESELKDKNYRTLGEFQYIKKIYRFNMEYDKKDAKEDSIYPFRKLYEYEFNQIWDKQASFYPQLTGDLKKKFSDAIFYQRPLKEQEKGFCLFEDNEHREYKASLIFQKFRFYQTLNQLKIIDKGIPDSLNDEKKKKIINMCLFDFPKMNAKDKLTFAAVRKEIGLTGSDRHKRFNIESEKRDDMPYDTTSYILSKDEFFGKSWFDKSEE